MDLAGLAAAARASGRLSLTAVWLSRFLGVVAAYDPAALRLPYYARLLAALAGAYRGAGVAGGAGAAGGFGCSAGAAALVRWSLGGLFAHAAFPQRVFFAALDEPPARPPPPPPAPRGLDSLELCDAAVLAELCPALRELQASLASSMCRVRAPARHVTPLRVAAPPGDRASARDQELQVNFQKSPRGRRSAGKRRRPFLFRDDTKREFCK